MPGSSAPHDEHADDLFVEEQRFSLVPEWVLDAPVSDAAFRLYALLLRYGNGSSRRMPSRATLARRLHRSTDTVDRALKELVSAGIVRVEHRRAGPVSLTNLYYVRTSPPDGRTPPAEAGTSVDDAPTAADRLAPEVPAEPLDADAAAPSVQSRRSGGSRNSAATHSWPGDTPIEGGRNGAGGGRNFAAGVAADLRPDREKLTERTPPPPAPSASPRAATAVEEELIAPLLAACGIADLAELVDECAARRRAAGRPDTRWGRQGVLAAIQLAVRGRGWPPALVVPALLTVAADPVTRSPMRLAEAGPWWDTAGAPQLPPPPAADELAALEARLDDTDGLRVRLQAEARRQLAAEHLPLTRATVLRRACQVLDDQVAGGPPAAAQDPTTVPVCDPEPREHCHA